MLYQVWCEDKLIADQSRPNYRMVSGSLKTKVSNAGSLNLKLERNNPGVDAIELLRSRITVTRDETPIWGGRCVQLERDTHWAPTISCDGGLACLQDSLLDPMSLGGNPNKVVAQILAAHNSMTGARQHFSLRKVVSELGWVNIETKNYTSAWAMMQTLLKTYGGYIIPLVNVNGMYNGFDWNEYLNQKGSQPVVLGVNISSLTRRLVAKDVYTGLIPTSEYKTLDENDREVKQTLDLSNYAASGYTQTILGDPRLHIVASDDMCIYRQKQFDINGVSDASILAAHAEKDLIEGSRVLVEWEVRATDRSYTENGFEPFELGKMYPVKAALYGIDEWLPLTEMDLDLVQPQKSTYLLGGSKPYISRMVHAN